MKIFTCVLLLFTALLKAEEKPVPPTLPVEFQRDAFRTIDDLHIAQLDYFTAKQKLETAQKKVDQMLAKWGELCGEQFKIGNDPEKQGCVAKVGAGAPEQK